MPEIKAILIGESGVGKTNLINVITGRRFKEDEETTFSNSFVGKTFNINQKNYKVQLWDTIGQEKYKNLTKLFFKDSKIVILVYDKSEKQTFKKLDFWKDEVKNSLGDDIILAIIGNKGDKDETIDDVNEDEAREYANNLNAKFRITSAKVNAKGFEKFLEELLIDYIKKNGGDIENNDDKFVLDRKRKKKKSKMKC